MRITPGRAAAPAARRSNARRGRFIDSPQASLRRAAYHTLPTVLRPSRSESGNVQVNVQCAGFRTPAATSYPRAPEAGVRKAPRHEIAGGRPRSAVPLAQLWGFKRRTCRVRASERREVD